MQHILVLKVLRTVAVNSCRLEKISDDIHADITFYEGLYEYMSRFDFPGREIHDLLLYWDIILWEEIFPTKESALQYIMQKLKKLVRARDAHNRLAQIVLRVEVARDDDEQQQEVHEVHEEMQHEVISAGPSSSATFDTQ